MVGRVALIAFVVDLAIAEIGVPRIMAAPAPYTRIVVSRYRTIIRLRLRRPHLRRCSRFSHRPLFRQRLRNFFPLLFLPLVPLIPLFYPAPLSVFFFLGRWGWPGVTERIVFVVSDPVASPSSRTFSRRGCPITTLYKYKPTWRAARKLQAKYQ